MARAGDGTATQLRDRVRAAVQAHPPADDRERESCRGLLEVLETLPRPFEEDADRRHVTGSAVIVGPRGTVLHLHKRLHLWLQPGGHVDPGEGPWDAALRESAEETGLALAHPADGPRLVHVDVHEGAKGHEHYDLRYLLLAEDADPAPREGESPHARWFSWAEASRLADESLAGALAAARRQPETAGAGDRSRSGR